MVINSNKKKKENKYLMKIKEDKEGKLKKVVTNKIYHLHFFISRFRFFTSIKKSKYYYMRKRNYEGFYNIVNY